MTYIALQQGTMRYFVNFILRHSFHREFPTLSNLDPSVIGEMTLSSVIFLLNREDLNSRDEISALHLALNWLIGNASKSVKQDNASAYQILAQVRFAAMNEAQINACRKLAIDKGSQARRVQKK